METGHISAVILFLIISASMYSRMLGVAASIILIVVPLFLPAVEGFGGDLVWFGIVTVVGAEIGLLTPPLGLSCFAIKSTIDDSSITLFDIFSSAFPFAVAMVLVLLIAYPALSLILI